MDTHTHTNNHTNTRSIGWNQNQEPEPETEADVVRVRERGDQVSNGDIVSGSRNADERTQYGTDERTQYRTEERTLPPSSPQTLIRQALEEISSSVCYIDMSSCSLLDSSNNRPFTL